MGFGCIWAGIPPLKTMFKNCPAADGIKADEVLLTEIQIPEKICLWIPVLAELAEIALN